MQHAEQQTLAPFLRQQPTADFCDANPAAQVLQARFLSFGGVGRCVGPVETVSARDDNSVVRSALSEPGQGRVLFIDNGASTNCAMLGGDLARLAADADGVVFLSSWAASRLPAC